MSFNQSGQIVLSQTNITGNVNTDGGVFNLGNINTGGGDFIESASSVGHIKFPKIPRLYNLVKEVQYYADKNEQEYPVLNFLGTTKLHGTNAAIIRDTNGRFVYQSRNKIITPVRDNAGFAQWCSEIDSEVWHEMFDVIEISLGIQHQSTNVRIFGEFVGPRINSGVAVNKLSKSFFIFGAYTDVLGWVDTTIFNKFESEEDSIYNIHHFKGWKITVDFNNPQEAQERIQELTDVVGVQCPVSKDLGITGAGEGIVWQCIDDGHSNIMFKSISEIYAEVKSTPKDKEIKDKTPFEVHINACITEARLNKVIVRMSENDVELIPQNTRVAMTYMAEDIWEEEFMTLEELGGNLEDVKSKVGKVGRMYNQMIQKM